MGLYPRTDRSKPQRVGPNTTAETWTETLNRFDGVLRYRQVYAGPWIEGERTTCYCCSCAETDNSTFNDPACRNHGWAAQRPCELHNMAGKPYDDGKIPASVQAQNRWNAR